MDNKKLLRLIQNITNLKSTSFLYYSTYTNVNVAIDYLQMYPNDTHNKNGTIPTDKEIEEIVEFLITSKGSGIRTLEYFLRSKILTLFEDKEFASYYLNMLEEYISINVLLKNNVDEALSYIMMYSELKLDLLIYKELLSNAIDKTHQVSSYINTLKQVYNG